MGNYNYYVPKEKINRVATLNTQPITIAFKSIKQKSFRELHCLECGWPILEITDKIAVITDATEPVEYMKADVMGITQSRCKNCKQYYRVDMHAQFGI